MYLSCKYNFVSFALGRLYLWPFEFVLRLYWVTAVMNKLMLRLFWLKAEFFVETFISQCWYFKKLMRHKWDFLLLRLYYDSSETLLRHCWDFRETTETQVSSLNLLRCLILSNKILVKLHCWDIAEIPLRNHWDTTEIS